MSIDEQGMPFAPLGAKLFFLKVAAIGAVALAEFIFMKWRKYKDPQRQQQRLEQNMNVLAIQGSPSQSDVDTPQQHYDWNALSAREQQQQVYPQLMDRDQQSYPQLMAECRELRQQLKEQKVEFHKIIDEEKQKYHYLQRAQLGLETREQKRDEQFANLQQLVAIKQGTIDEQNMLLQALEEPTTTKRPTNYDKDLIWEMDNEKKGPWHNGRSSTNIVTTADIQKEDIGNGTPTYAMAANTTLASAIDNWIDDYIAHGGNVSDRNIVDKQIVADWGIRVRQRMHERVVTIKDSNNDKVSNKIGGKECQTLIGKIRRIFNSPTCCCRSCLCANLLYSGSSRIACSIMVLHFALWLYPILPIICPRLFMMVHAGQPSVVPYFVIALRDTCKPCAFLWYSKSSSSMPASSLSATSFSSTVSGISPFASISTNMCWPNLSGTNCHGTPCMPLMSSLFHLSSSVNLFTIRHLTTPAVVPMIVSSVLSMVPNHNPNFFGGSPLLLLAVFIGTYITISPKNTTGTWHCLSSIFRMVFAHHLQVHTWR